MTDHSEDTPQIETEDFADEHGVSLSSKVLSGVALMVLGGVFALWIGPKIAPVLPAGMAPVAAWLAPGSVANKVEITKLRTDLQNQIDAIPTLSTRDVEALVSYSTDSLRLEVNGQINGLVDQMNATDSSDIEGRLAALELKSDGLRAELSSLLAQISEVSVAGGNISSETSAQIAAYSAEMDGLRAEIEMLAAHNGALSQKIDGVSISANRQVAEAETRISEVTQIAVVERNTTALNTSLQAIEVALFAGLDFAGPLAGYEAAGAGDVPVALADASGGVATMAHLRADFPEAAHAAIRESILTSAGDGLLSGAGAFLRAQVASRSLTPQEGLAPDAVLSRAEAALKQDDLEGALREIDALPLTTGLMADWIARATERMDAVAAFRTLTTQAEASK